MARIKLELPDHFHFRTEVLVQEQHLHRGLHLGSATLFTLLNEARIAFFVSLGWSEVDVDGAGTIMSDAVVVYKAESFLGDTLSIEMTAGDFSRTGCDLYYRVANARTGAEVARAKTAIGFFDYASRKIVPVPEGFRKRFA